MAVLYESLFGYDGPAARLGWLLRPNKPINSGAHRSGSAGGKNRYFTTGLPDAREEDQDTEPTRQLELPDSAPAAPRELLVTKYDGRGTVGPRPDDEPEITIDLTQEDWEDPLDAEDEVDLANVTIDLRTTMRQDAPDTYYQRFGTRIPGRE